MCIIVAIEGASEIRGMKWMPRPSTHATDSLRKSFLSAVLGVMLRQFRSVEVFSP